MCRSPWCEPPLLNSEYVYLRTPLCITNNDIAELSSEITTWIIVIELLQGASELWR